MKMKNKVLAVLVLALLMINILPAREAKADAKVFTPRELYNIACHYAEDKYNITEANAPNRLMFYNAAYQNVTFIFSNSNLNFVDSTDAGYDYTLYKSSKWFFGRVNRATGAVSDASDYYYIIKEAELDLISWSSSQITVNGVFNSFRNEFPLLPIVLPTDEPGYDYWFYHKTTSGEYMYWSKDPFNLEKQDDKYILTLSTGDIVYRLHMDPSHKFYRQVLTGTVQYVINIADVFRPGQKIQFDDVTIDPWEEGDVTTEIVDSVYQIPHITSFIKRIRGARSPIDAPREYYMSIELGLSGDFDAAVTEQKILIDGIYIMPSEAYFRMCDDENIEPSMNHFMNLVKSNQEEYYLFVDWNHTELIKNLPGLDSDYGFHLNYSGVVDALIERGEFDDLYTESVRLAYDDDIRRLCCPYRLACTLIGVVDGKYYYGDTYITVLYSELDSNQKDVSGIYSDYVSLDNDQRTDAVESTINGVQDDSLKEYIDKKDAQLNALIEEYEMKLATLDATISRVEVGDGNLFGTFSSLANGISGLSGSFRNIAIAVGNVFAFFPQEITSILFAGFVSCIIIAVYKALRG